MKNTTKKKIVSAIEYLMVSITFGACIAFIIAVVTMLRDWTITTTTLTIVIASLAWVGLMFGYIHLIEK